MSNKRKIRKPGKKAAAKPDPAVRQQVRRKIDGALRHLERRGMVDRDPSDHTWSITALGSEHGTYRGVTVAVQSRRVTAAGLLKIRLSQADGAVRERDLVRIEHAPTGCEGVARVRRVTGRTGLAYLEAQWDATLEKPTTRTPSQARAQARPKPCESCGAEPGADCVTRAGKRALWPHACRDPLIGIGSHESEMAKSGLGEKGNGNDWDHLDAAAHRPG